MNNTNIITAVAKTQQKIADAIAAPGLISNTAPLSGLSPIERAAEIKRIAGYANAVTALLETIEMVPVPDQADIIAVASSIANDVARDLASLIGGVQ